MTLAFSQFIDKKPTYFVEKILKGIHHLPIGKEFRDYVLSDYYQEAFNEIKNPKIHTIRADTKNRWKVGSKIHMVINNRTKNRLQFAPVLEVKQVQDFEIKDIKVKVTYEVGLGGLDATEQEFNQLKELFEDGKELEGMGYDKFNEAREWLNAKIQERDCCDISYEIKDLG